MYLDTEPNSVSEYQIDFSLQGIISGSIRGSPLILTSFPFGLIFGVLAKQTGLSLQESVFMSGAVFAGSAQIIALGLWKTPLPIFAIIITTFFINMRMMLMGATLRSWFGKLPAWQAYLSLAFLTDGGWALTLQEFKEKRYNGAFLIGNGITLFICWILSTALGFAVGTFIEQPAKFGLDFFVTAAFLSLIVGKWNGRRDIFPWCVAAIAALIVYQLIPGNWYILAGGLSGSLSGAIKNDE